MKIAFFLIVFIIPFQAYSETAFQCPTDIPATLRANAEAEILAIESTGCLSAPQVIYDKIVQDLSAILDKYVPIYKDLAKIIARGDFDPSALIISFYDDSFKSDQWYSLNRKYHLENIRHSNYTNHSFLLKFKGRLNIPLLVKEYSILPSFESAEPNYYFGGRHDISLKILEDTYEYFFKFGSGDCFAGCISKIYWKFSIDVNQNITGGQLKNHEIEARRRNARERTRTYITH